MSTRIPSQEEYEAREARMAHQQLQDVEKAPLADRKEGAKNYLRAMSEDPALVAERISWLLDGNYGRGLMMKGKQIVQSPRMNRTAALGVLIAAAEWQCPGRMAADMWKKLSHSQKEVLDQAISVVVTAAEKDEE